MAKFLIYIFQFKLYVSKTDYFIFTMADSAADRHATTSSSSNINTYDLDTEMSGITSHCPVIVHEDHTDKSDKVATTSESAMLIPSLPAHPADVVIINVTTPNSNHNNNFFAPRRAIAPKASTQLSYQF